MILFEWEIPGKCKSLEAQHWELTQQSDTALSRAVQIFLWKVSNHSMYDMNVEQCVGNGYASCSLTHEWLSWYFVTSFQVSFATGYFGILIKANSVPWVALIGDEFISKAAGEAAVILKHIWSLYSPEGQYCGSCGLLSVHPSVRVWWSRQSKGSSFTITLYVYHTPPIQTWKQPQFSSINVGDPQNHRINWVVKGIWDHQVQPMTNTTSLTKPWHWLHIQSFYKHVQAWWLHHLPQQDSRAQSLFSVKNFFPDV